MAIKFPGFGKNKYQQHQVSSVPEGQSTNENGTYILEEKRQIIIKIMDSGNPIDLAIALGTLQIAADIIKQTLTKWHASDRQRTGIIVPPPANGVGHG